MVTSLLLYRHQTFATATGVSQSLTFHSTPKAKHGDDEHSTTVDKTSQGSKGTSTHPSSTIQALLQHVILLLESDTITGRIRGYYRSQLRNELLNDMGQIQRTAHCTTKTCHSVLRLRSSSAGSIRPHMKQLLVQRHREKCKAAIVELRLLDLRLPGLPRCITREPRTVWACMIFGDWSTNSSWLSLFEKV